MVARESKPPKPLKVKSMPGLDIGPDELKAKQKAAPILRKYWKASRQMNSSFAQRRVYYTTNIVENRMLTMNSAGCSCTKQTA